MVNSRAEYDHAYPHPSRRNSFYSEPKAGWQPAVPICGLLSPVALDRTVPAVYQRALLRRIDGLMPGGFEVFPPAGLRQAT